MAISGNTASPSKSELNARRESRRSANLMADLISKFKTNPIPPLELTKISREIRYSTASVQDFSAFYHRDPVLSTYLIDLAWQKSIRKTNPPFAADHAMSVIGIDTAKDYFSQLGTPAFKNSKILPLTDEVKFIMTSSLLAAELAKNLCSNRQKSKQLYWAAMTHQFPETILWHFFPKQMWQVHYQKIKSGQNLAFEQKTFGFEVNQWQQAITREWHLSKMNRTTYSTPIPNNRKELCEYMVNGMSDKTASLDDWHQTDSWQIITANWLARAIMSPWFVNSFQHCSLLAKQAFATSDKNTNNAITESIRITSTNLKESCLFVPAIPFLSIAGPRIYPVWLVPTPVRVLGKIEKPQKKIMYPELYRLIKELTAKSKSNQSVMPPPIQSPNPNPSRNQKLKPSPNPNPGTDTNRFKISRKLFSRILSVCIKELGFSRACLLTVDWTSKTVSTSIALHRKSDEKIQPQFDLSQKTPLSKIFKEEGLIYFEINRHSKIWKSLPIEIILQQVQNFILFSLKPNNRVEALIYLDLKGKKPLSADKFRLVKILLKAANKAMHSYP